MLKKDRRDRMQKNISTSYPFTQVTMFVKFTAPFLAFLTLALSGNAMPPHPKQSHCDCYPVPFHTFTKSFEKIYVTPAQVLSMPQGLFLKHANGRLERVYSLSEDYEGTFVLKIYSQCSHCGRVYHGTTAPEGWSCFESS